MRFFMGNACIQCMHTVFEIQISFKEKTQRKNRFKVCYWPWHKLTVHLFINVNKFQLIFSSRKAETREALVMVSLYLRVCFAIFLWSMKDHCQYFVLSELSFYPEALLLKLSVLWMQHPCLDLDPLPLFAFLSSLSLSSLTSSWTAHKITPATSYSANGGHYWITENVNEIFTRPIVSPESSETFY